MSTWVTHTGYTVVEGELDVWNAAIDRVRQIYKLGLPVSVSFSGGKDSTCVMMLALQVARELDKLPVNAVMIDEEVIDPDTISYVSEVAKWPEIDFHWLCVPVRHTLRSRSRSHWFTWDPDERAKWARELPPGAVTEIPGYIRKDGGYEDVIRAYYEHIGLDPATQVAGIRADESYNRRRAIITSGSHIHKRRKGYYTKPIYDWGWRDVWKAIKDNGWLYSKFYDKTFTEGLSPRQSRVAPWGNVAQSRNVYLYPIFYPDFWERAIIRLPELRAAARYGKSKLYREIQNKPAGMTWQEYTFFLIDQVGSEDDRKYWVSMVAQTLKRWAKVSSVPLPDEDFSIGGKRYLKSWKRLAFMVSKNDRTADGSSRDQM